MPVLSSRGPNLRRWQEAARGEGERRQRVTVERRACSTQTTTRHHRPTSPFFNSTMFPQNVSDAARDSQMAEKSLINPGTRVFSPRERLSARIINQGVTRRSIQITIITKNNSNVLALAAFVRAQPLSNTQKMGTCKNTLQWTGQIQK